MADYAAKDLKYKRIAIVADDLTFSQEVAAGFQHVFEESGGKIVQKIFSPISTPDYATYVTQLKPNLDAVFISFSGANGPRFLKAFGDYGLRGKVAVLAGMTTVDEAILHTMGDDVIGVLSSGWYSAALRQPRETASSSPSSAPANKSDPGLYAVGAYSAGLFLEQAVDRGQRQGGGQAGVHEGAEVGADQVLAARARSASTTTPTRSSTRTSAGWSARTDGSMNVVHQDLSERQPVLDLRPEGVPREPGVLARVAAGEEPRIAPGLLERCTLGRSRPSTASPSRACCSCSRRASRSSSG